MIWHVRRVLLVAGLLALAACAAYRTKEQRTTEGPMAEDIWALKVVLANGRDPNIDERRRWDNQLELRISQYLREHPEAANSLDVSTFRFIRQVSIGQTAEQVLILLGPPALRITDEGEIAQLARQYWPAVQSSNPTEAWTYPAGWRLYFKDLKVVDITQYLPPP